MFQSFAFQDEYILGTLAQGVDAGGDDAGAMLGEYARDLSEQPRPVAGGKGEDMALVVVAARQADFRL